MEEIEERLKELKILRMNDKLEGSSIH